MMAFAPTKDSVWESHKKCNFYIAFVFYFFTNGFAAFPSADDIFESSNGGKGLVQRFNQIIDIFNADGKTDGIGLDSLFQKL